MKKNKPEQEKRQNVRFRILSIVKHATEPDVATFRVGNIQDISRGGFSFFAEQEIKAGSILQLLFLPPNREKPVEVRGKAVRCSKASKKAQTFEIGIQFLDVSKDAGQAIQELEVLFLGSKKTRHAEVGS